MVDYDKENSGVPYHLSLSDLYLIDNFKEVFDSLPRNPVHWPAGKEKDFVLKTLFENGMMPQNIEVSEPVQHRNLRNQVVLCSRIEGYERCEEAWLRSGCASLNAVIAGCRDASLRADLVAHSRTSCDKSTQDMLERAAHSEARKVSKQSSKEG